MVLGQKLKRCLGEGHEPAMGRERVSQYAIELGQAAKFAAVGILNTGVDVALFCLLHYNWAVPALAANTVSYCTGVANSYFLNRSWTFAEYRDDNCVLCGLFLFFALYSAGLGLSNLVMWLMADGFPVLVAKFCATGVTFVWNFFSTRRFVYRRKLVER